MGRISYPPCFGVPVQNYCNDRSRSTCLLWKRTLPIRWGSTLTTSISASRFTTTWPIWCFNFFTNITRLLRPLPKQKTCSRSSMTYIVLMSCSRLNIRRHNELRLPQRYHLRKRMQSWLHRRRPTTHNLRRRPAPCPRSVRRPSMPSRLMVRFSNNHGSSSLFTDFPPRLPSRRRHSSSPCAARQKTSSSTTHGPVINHACISSNRPLPLQWRHWLRGPITRPQRQQVFGIYVDPALSGSTHAKTRCTYVCSYVRSVGT